MTRGCGGSGDCAPDVCLVHTGNCLQQAARWLGCEGCGEARRQMYGSSWQEEPSVDEEMSPGGLFRNQTLQLVRFLCAFLFGSRICPWKKPPPPPIPPFQHLCFLSCLDCTGTWCWSSTHLINEFLFC